MKITDLKLNPNNPQKYTDEAIETLKQSIKDFPKMMSLRPMVYDPKTMYVLGGNKRLLSIQRLGFKEIPDTWAKSAQELTEDEMKRFIVQDNIQVGDWDWEILQRDWDSEELEEWGLEVDVFKEIDKADKKETLHFEKSLQVIPKKEYIIIMADEYSDDWEELKAIFKCKRVRQGGCKIGSRSDKVSTGLERVFDLKTFKERVLNGF